MTIIISVKGNPTKLHEWGLLGVKKMKKSILIKGLLTIVFIVVLQLACLPVEHVYASKIPTISKSELNFESASAKAQTVLINNLKASKVKKVEVTNVYEDIVRVTAKKKSGKIVINVKPIAAGEAGPVVIHTVYKKAINGDTEGFFYLDKITVHGGSSPDPTPPSPGGEVAIYNAEDLFKIKDYSEGTVYTLQNDIDMTDVKTPLVNSYGSRISLCDVTLDGNGHAIRNLSAPFIAHNAGTVKNIRFENFTIDYNSADSSDIAELFKEYSSSAAPFMVNEGTIENCYVSGKISIGLVDGSEVSSKLTNVGGLVGENYSMGVIRRCRSDVDITINYEEHSLNPLHVGGICGESGSNEPYNRSTITECMNSGNIITHRSGAFAGGITGWAYGSFSDCLNTGKVIGDDGNTDIHAGLFGWYSNADVTNCLNNGEAKYGINGYPISNTQENWEEDMHYTNVYNVSSKAGHMFFQLGNVFEVPGTHAVLDTELMDQNTFRGFDFTNTWEMGSNGPVLRNIP